MDQIQATNTELWGLYNVLRSSYLNQLYYGSRVTATSRLNLSFQVVASIGSLGAVAAVVSAMPRTASIVAAIAAICAALPVALGLADKLSRYERLHFSYCELFQLTQKAAMDIRREGILTDEQRGVAKLLADLYSRLGQHDDPDHKDKVHDRCEAAVRQKYPPSSLWYAGVEYGGQTTSSSAPAESTPVAS